MKLQKFCKFLNLVTDDNDEIISSITANSEDVNKGSVFIALKGSVFDGNDYIEDVLSKGAILVLSDNDNMRNQNKRISYIENLSSKLGDIASIFYQNLPSNIIAVTGTNGKSSVVDIARQLFIALKADAASFGTMGLYYNNKIKSELSHTTPDIFSLYKSLNNLKLENFDNVLFEASSHGIEQGRIDNIPINIAVFTNLTQDHLDFHGNMENYFCAKSKLFSKHLNDDGVAIINADSNYAKKLKSICGLRGIKYFDFGKGAKDVRILDSGEGAIIIEYQGTKYEVPCHLTGSFQIYNMVCAISILINSGINLEQIIPVCSAVKAVAGRLEEIPVGNHKGYKVFIDYAHTPDALEKALQSLKDYVKHPSRLIVVFGCGGNRDHDKRFIMGEIAKQNSDYVIVTDDNPRNEDPKEIRSEILSAVPNAKEIADRKEAILHALNIAKPGDIILIAGKGHENYQIIGNKKIDFDDAQIVRNEVL